MVPRTNAVILLAAQLRDRAYEHVSCELERLGMSGCAPSHGAILIALYREKALSLKELAMRIDKKKSSTTELVDKLIRLGYVEKTISDEDQRVKVVRLTQQSLDFKNAFIELTDNVNARVFKGFTKAEREQFVQLLTKAVSNY